MIKRILVLVGLVLVLVFLWRYNPASSVTTTTNIATHSQTCTGLLVIGSCNDSRTTTTTTTVPRDGMTLEELAIGLAFIMAAGVVTFFLAVFARPPSEGDYYQ